MERSSILYFVPVSIKTQKEISTKYDDLPQQVDEKWAKRGRQWKKKMLDLGCTEPIDLGCLLVLRHPPDS